MSRTLTHDGSHAALSDKERRAYHKARIDKLVYDGQARRVCCPTCLAPPYENCRSRGSSYETDWHVGRLELAGLR